MNKENDNKFAEESRINLMIVSMVWLVILLPTLFGLMSQTDNLSYSQFLTYTNDGRVKEVAIAKDRITGLYTEPKSGKERRFNTVRVDDSVSRLLTEKHIPFSGREDQSWVNNLVGWAVGIFVLMFLISLMHRGAGGSTDNPNMSPFTFGKSKARIYREEEVRITFADVAGVDEAKEELKEIISFLKFPDKYRKLGGRLPKGVLLVGPPGTGKTLLARAVAGEAGVPFFSISGSEFVELFVGVGAARVRDLFQQAGTRAPCIIFIDELDALGKARGVNPLMGTHDEKEQTLNQLLAELDGFDPRLGIILLAATNRPEILDPALLRAGRFDRQILVDRPDKKGRIEIMNVHLRGIPCDESVDIERIAAMTTGFTGADLANLVNEAALLAARHEAEKVAMKDVVAAIERIVAGLEKKNRLLNAHETEVVSFHEMGHALVALNIPGSDPIQKISIIPRGIGALGYTLQRPTEDRFLMTKEELENKMAILLGGRASEWIVFASLSTGAADDLQKASEIARHMVTRYGMAEKLGMAVYESESGAFLNGSAGSTALERRYSEETAREIDCAIRDLVASAFQRAHTILESNRDSLDRGACLLMQKETLSAEELMAALGVETAGAQVLNFEVAGEARSVS